MALRPRPNIPSQEEENGTGTDMKKYEQDCQTSTTGDRGRERPKNSWKRSGEADVEQDSSTAGER